MRLRHAKLKRVGHTLLAALLCGTVCQTARAADPAAHAAGELWQTVSESTLAQLRGGFDLGGLMVSFGITRAVYVNGALLTETTLNLGQLSQLTPVQAAQVGSQIGAVNLVQNGPGNSVTPGLTGAGTIIQNTLNNQNIDVRTMINASSNGLGMVRGLNSLRTLNDALAGSVGGR